VVASGETVTVSCWAYVNDTADFWMRVRNATAGATLTSVSPTKTGEWEKLVYTWENTTGGSVDIQIWATNREDNSSTEVWVDACQVEINSFASPICHGGMGDGHSWSGTPHNSTSIRTIASLSYATPSNVLDLSKPISISLWMQRYVEYLVVSSRLVEAGGGLRIFFISSYEIQIMSGGDWANSGTLSLSDEPVHVVYTRTSTEQKLYVSGELKTTGTVGATVPDGTMYIGDRSAGDRTFNGRIDDFAILDRALTADEVKAIYESNMPLVVPSGYNHGA
jgi:hypothetical protein